MDQQGVEEDSVALLQLQVNSGVLRVIVSHSVVHFVHAALERGNRNKIHIRGDGVSPTPRSYLPLGVVVLVQGASVCPREDDQAAILSVHFLHRSPSTHDLVNGTEREVVQILVHWVTRRLLTYDNGYDNTQAAKFENLYFCQPNSCQSIADNISLYATSGSLQV